MSDEKVHFRLYVAGDSPNARLAVANLEEICRCHLADRHVIEIIDIFLSPEKALADGVLLTPALVVVSVSPVRMLVGTLSKSEALLLALNLTPLAT